MNFRSMPLVPSCLSGTIRFEAEVRNHGVQIQDGATAVLQVDGQDVSRQSVGPIRAGESKVRHSTRLLMEEEMQKFVLELSADSLNQDNARQTVVHVRDRTRVLCAHGEEVRPEVSHPRSSGFPGSCSGVEEKPREHLS